MNSKPQHSILLLMKSVLLAVVCAFVSIPAIAQLRLVSVSLPDTVAMNDQINVQFAVKNQGANSRVGNLQLEFLNSSNDSITSPLGVYENTLQFFAPQQTRDFTVDIEITPSFFVEGGNTVVIWPSMVTDPELPAEPILKSIYVLGSTGGLALTRKNEISLLNPVYDVLKFADASGRTIHGNVTIYSASALLIGQFKLEAGKAELPELPAGMYYAILLRENIPAQCFRFVHLQP
jgi:hypothetical protein